ncbi:MAG: Holliday junction resolvase RuvX [Candidatus Acidiferrales bacterium]
MPVTSEGKPGRILAVDYGRKRIGLALSDELGLAARPLGILARTNRRNDMRRLRDICRGHSIGLIIVGHPLHITGEAGEMAHEAARFAARLGKAFMKMEIEVELADERLTTWEARQTVAATESSRRKRDRLDDVAAAILLRDYLERKRSPARAAAERD